MLNEVFHLTWPQPLTLSYGRVKLGQCNVFGLKPRGHLAERTGLWVEAGPRAGWREGEPGQEHRPTPYCQNLILRREIDAGLGKPLLVHIAQSFRWCM